MKLDCNKVWKSCMDIVEESIDPIAFKTWFKPIIPLSLKKNVLTIQVPSLYFYEIIEEQYIDSVSKALRSVLGRTAKLEYSVDVEDTRTAEKSNLQNRAVSPKSSGPLEIRNPFVIPGIAKLDIDPQLNADYTFDNFVEGECNRLARTASLAVAKDPGKTAFNPLFIYGSSGLGKTHLAQAIGIEVKSNYPEKTVLYVSANKFQTQFTDSYRNNSTNDFLNFYQMIDVLIIDDIQEFIGKKGTQNTFFHIFNHLHQNNKQLILTCDKPPADLKGMEERLLSRFKWGLPAEIMVPDFETRMNILKQKIHKDGIRVSEDVVHYLASHINTNVRELEGALISLLFLSTIDKKEISLNTAQNVVDKLIRRSSRREISVDHIQQTVCEYYGLELESLQSKTRKREVVQARQIAMYFSKNLTKSSLATIGSKIGQKDHSTVLYAYRTITNLIETDRDFKTQIREIEAQLKS